MNSKPEVRFAIEQIKEATTRIKKFLDKLDI